MLNKIFERENAKAKLEAIIKVTEKEFTQDIRLRYEMGKT